MNSLPSGTKVSLVLSSTEKLKGRERMFRFYDHCCSPVGFCLRHASALDKYNALLFGSVIVPPSSSSQASVWGADRSPADRSPADRSPAVLIAIFKTRTLLSPVNPFNSQSISEIHHGFCPLTDKRRAPQAGRTLG
jgi:hypothetical protein